ncbi:hypothetical protein C8Q76DRAFT_695762 [Earliella scabrosa]|nr:hypothetical protein C8Q76DRAFT_695762 [Earliella scabrosa]
MSLTTTVLRKESRFRPTEFYNCAASNALKGGITVSPNQVSVYMAQADIPLPSSHSITLAPSLADQSSTLTAESPFPTATSSGIPSHPFPSHPRPPSILPPNIPHPEPTAPPTSTMQSSTESSATIAKVVRSRSSAMPSRYFTTTSRALTSDVSESTRILSTGSITGISLGAGLVTIVMATLLVRGVWRRRGRTSQGSVDPATANQSPTQCSECGNLTSAHHTGCGSQGDSMHITYLSSMHRPTKTHLQEFDSLHPAAVREDFERSPSPSSDNPRGVDLVHVAADNMRSCNARRYETDGGVRLAGGRPGSHNDGAQIMADSQSTLSQSSTLPPPYCEDGMSRTGSSSIWTDGQYIFTTCVHMRKTHWMVPEPLAFRLLNAFIFRIYKQLVFARSYVSDHFRTSG